MRQAITVSDEMTTLIGRGAATEADLPPESVMFAIDHLGSGSHLIFRDDVRFDGLEDAPLWMVVQRAACERLFSVQPDGCRTWHLPSALLALAVSIVECEAEGEARTALRLARSIELLCQIHAALAGGVLVAVDGDCSLNEMDVRRIASARRVVDQRWHEKLTIAELARVAGVNRDKLVRGFRDLYGSTVAEVLAERRLVEARRMLLVTDLPVASVAYRCSYLNNAAFSRAFTRRFGMAPSQMRRMGVAA